MSDVRQRRTGETILCSSHAEWNPLCQDLATELGIEFRITEIPPIIVNADNGGGNSDSSGGGESSRRRTEAAYPDPRRTEHSYAPRLGTGR
jgi:hypothetical protein